MVQKFEAILTGGRCGNRSGNFRRDPGSVGIMGGVRDHRPAAPGDPPVPVYPPLLPAHLASLGEDGQFIRPGAASGNLAERLRPPVAPPAHEHLGRRTDHGLRPPPLVNRLGPSDPGRERRVLHRPLPERHHLLYPRAGGRCPPEHCWRVFLW